MVVRMVRIMRMVLVVRMVRMVLELVLVPVVDFEGLWIAISL
jgi:hypothetical protein